ncbi:hypothetical protein EUGRSUZ_E03382 [Eucalyptus grandis]|uniref:Uncharacterized protein n=2 Tax=Eucalyptus grandis TaxID=71139 RepID=A0ACC3KZB1_EUCGR|nr:hypothetical protein EUGRSUZ_E03382 [Eucalyptus grandis]
MSQDIVAALQCLNESPGGSTCTIFRTPEAIGGGIAKACRPRIVSIGPYHHGEQQLQMLQKHKWRYLHTMLDQTQHSVGLEDLINTVALKVEMIRQCYSESTEYFNGPDLVKMMVVDGCFIIQFLRQIAGVMARDRRMDPPLNNSYVLYSVARDLLQLENQVPYFVLEDLFETTNVPEATWSLANLASYFFSCFDLGPGYVLERQINKKESQQDSPVEKSSYRPLIRSASELRRVGIGFKQGQASTFLGIKFDNERRTVRIPQTEINDDLNCILPNMTADDVQLLRDCKVISNYGMSNQDVARFFSDVWKDAIIDIPDTYLALHFSFLNESFKYEWAHLCWAQLLNAFHDNPWSTLSGLAVVVTLVGIIQIVYAVLQYYHPK